MDQKNVTTINLLGFPGLHGVKPLLFLLFLITYFGTIGGNILVITIVAYSKNLHCPMYFFLTQLTMSDIIVTSDIVPTMLYIILKDGITMSLSQCIIQFYFFGSCEGFECLLLTVMSYDRYLAICNPLHYGSIMNPRLCRKSIVICWLSSFLVTIIQALNISQLPFLESNVIDHFFCDLDPILQLSTSDILAIETLEMYLCIPVVLFPFLIIIISYVYIVRTILNIRSITGRQKAFTTCTSHLIVVSIFFGTLGCMYFIPINKKSVVKSKTISLFYTVVTPLLNPTIYCLRNNDIREALRKKIVSSELAVLLENLHSICRSTSSYFRNVGIRGDRKISSVKLK